VREDTLVKMVQALADDARWGALAGQSC